MSSQSTPGTILIADDDRSIVDLFGARIREWGYRCVGASNREQLFAALTRERPSLLILDLHFGMCSGIDLLGETLAIDPDLMVVLLTGRGSISNAVHAIKQGAYDFLSKPPDWPRVERIVRSAIERRRMRERIAALEETVDAADRSASLLGDSASIRNVRDLIRTVAPTDAPVLVLGESGTGKELAARAVHEESGRPRDIFVAVNMAALPPTLVESSLFGHEKGAFTGADRSRVGSFEMADRGTLFLDEIGEMELSLQAKLLRFLQERTIERVGSSKSIAVDCRIVAATNRNLSEMIRQGKFREDLFYRLNVVPVRMPPLRSHREDIPTLAGRFLRRFALRYRKELTGFNAEALAALTRYDWPGNVRELENLIERLVILVRPGAEIGLDAIPPEICGTSKDLPEDSPVAGPEAGLGRIERIERQAIVDALAKSNGHIRLAAEYLGLGQATVYRKLKRYNIPHGATGQMTKAQIPKSQRMTKLQ